MTMQSIGHFFVRVDRISDRVPLLSTATNLVDLFLKTICGAISCFTDRLKGGYVYEHLKDKSLIRCLILLVPGLGNLTVWFFDQKTKNDLLNVKARAPAPSEAEPEELESEEVGSENETPSSAEDIDLKKRPDPTPIESKKFTSRMNRGLKGRLASDPNALKDDATRQEVKEALNSGVSLKHFPECSDDEELVKLAITHNGSNFRYASERFRSQLDYLSLAVQTDLSAFQNAEGRLKCNDEKSRKFLKECLNKDSYTLAKHPSFLILMRARMSDGESLRHYPDLSHVEDIVDIALKKKMDNFKYVCPQIKYSENYIGRWLETKPSARDFEDLFADEELMSLVVQIDGTFLREASDAIKENEMIVRSAIEQSPLAFIYAAPALREKEALLIRALKPKLSEEVLKAIFGSLRDYFKRQVKPQESDNQLKMIKRCLEKDPKAALFFQSEILALDDHSIKELIKNRQLRFPEGAAVITSKNDFIRTSIKTDFRIIFDESCPLRKNAYAIGEALEVFINRDRHVSDRESYNPDDESANKIFNLIEQLFETPVSQVQGMGEVSARDLQLFFKETVSSYDLLIKGLDRFVKLLNPDNLDKLARYWIEHKDRWKAGDMPELVEKKVKELMSPSSKS